VCDLKTVIGDKSVCVSRNWLKCAPQTCVLCVFVCCIHYNMVFVLFSLFSGVRKVNKQSTNRKFSLGSRRRSSSEFRSSTQRRSSLDVVTERQIALFSQRRLEKVAERLSPIEDKPVLSGVAVDEESSASLNESLVGTESRDLENELEVKCQRGAEPTSLLMETSNEGNLLSSGTEVCEVAPEGAESSFLDDDDEDAMGTEDALRRSGAKYFKKKINRAISEPPSDGFTSKPPPFAVDKRQAVRRTTYDLAMGVITIDDRNDLINQHKLRKSEKSGKEKKEISKLGKLVCEL